MKITIILTVLLSLSVQAEGDEITLKDGTVYHGKIVQQFLKESPDGVHKSIGDDGVERSYVHIYKFHAPNGRIYEFESSQVENVQLGDQSINLGQKSILSINDGYVEGRLAAEFHGTPGWFVGGIGSGLAGGLIGTGIIWIFAGSSGTGLHEFELREIHSKGDRYYRGYIGGHQERMQSKRKSSALGGGLIGTAVGVIILISAAN